MPLSFLQQIKRSPRTSPKGDATYRFPLIAPLLALALSTGCTHPGPTVASSPPPVAAGSKRTKLTKPVTSPTATLAGFQKPINTDFEGITCFRGNVLRNYTGEGPLPKGKLKILWRQGIGGNPKDGHWGGVGWTGQPELVAWPDNVRKYMNFLHQPGPKMEIIQGALDGQVHFYDAETGKPSRKPLQMPTRYPIKGTVTVDPRGYPLLYVGCGIDTGSPGYRIFSLLDFKVLLHLPAYDKIAPRHWAGSDSNTLILNDTLYFPAENALFYWVKLNTKWDPSTGDLSITPKVNKEKLGKYGVESSMAVWNDYGYCTDNIGQIWRINLKDPKQFKKIFETTDDTDSTPVFDQDGFFYVGNEKDKRGGAKSVKGQIFKINPKNASQVWKFSFECGSLLDMKPNPIDGGILSTGALDPADRTIFYTTSHHPRNYAGYLLALDMDTGKLKWKHKLRAFSWTSPIVADGAVFCCDNAGGIQIRDCKTGDSLLTDDSGKMVEYYSIGANMEGSPIVWKGKVYAGVRGGAEICIGSAE